MSKERLEKAKKILNHIKGYGIYDGNDDIEIFEWLIEQAERVEELEENNLQLVRENNEVNDEMIEMYKDNQRYKQALEEIARDRFPGASYKARKALERDND